MSELDFDELDKAVNSLIEKTTKMPDNSDDKKPVAPEAEGDSGSAVIDSSSVGAVETGLEIGQVEAAEKPAENNDQPQSNSTMTDEESPSKELVAPAKVPKSSGRFMDVVHPSSDMRPKLMTKSRHGNMIKPLNDMVEPGPKAPAPTPVEDATPEKTENKLIEQSWPDPIDMMQEKLASESDAKPEAEPNGSPFLPNAKVEKRPLGGEAPTSPSSLPSDKLQHDEEGPKTNDDLSLPVTDEEMSPLPDELNSDVVAIEADSPHPEVKTEEHRVSETVAQNGMTPSIVQQYKEQPSSADNQHAALYDTTLEKPLSHPPKKKSGWMNVVWVVLLVVVLGSVAAGLYYFKII